MSNVESVREELGIDILNRLLQCDNVPFSLDPGSTSYGKQWWSMGLQMDLKKIPSGRIPVVTVTAVVTIVIKLSFVFFFVLLGCLLVAGWLFFNK